MLTRTALAVFIAAGLAAQTAESQDAEELLQSAKVFGTAEFTEVTAELDIRQDSRRQTRTIEIAYAEEGPHARKVFAQIVQPRFLQQMRFLMRQASADETEQWLATSRGVRKLDNTGTSERLFSSDFTIEELTGFPNGPYDAEYRGTEDVDGFDTHVIHGEVDSVHSNYDSFLLRRERETGIIVWIEFFNANRLVKEYRLLEMNEKNGRHYTAHCRMESYDRNSRTELRVTSIQFPPRISESVFTRENLE
jgi:hypothetical protein